MGCSGSKAYDELPLVVRCRERRELIRAARNHRYALAAAHVSYLRSLKDVGDALRKFADEELITASFSPSLSSPSLILPRASKIENEKADKSWHLRDDEEEEEEESHLHISDSSSDDDGDPQPSYHSNNPDVYYLKKSAPAMIRVFQEPPAYGYLDSYWKSQAGYGGDFGYFPMGTAVGMGNSPGVKVRIPPPPSPKSSAWDFLNPFDMFDDGYAGYYSIGEYGNGSNLTSPDLSRARKKEGIPDLEEETEHYVSKYDLKGKRSSSPVSRALPMHESTESSSRSMPSHKSSEESDKPSALLQFIEESVKPSISLTDEKSSPETLVSKNVGAGSEVEKKSKPDIDSERLSSGTMLSPHGTRDLREVMAEIGNDFDIASGYGKEVAVMLEVGKLPYQPGFLKVILSRIMYLIAPSLTISDSPSMKYVKLASQSMKLAKSYIEDARKEANAKVCNLSSTLDKLYAWEKKLYKEIKDEERLRVTYERQCKRLTVLDEGGAESGKVYAVQDSIRKLLTKLDVSIRAIDFISSRIHELRDEELQPKVAALIHGLIRMWKAMLRCHKKQFEAIMQSRMQKLKLNFGLQTDSNSRLTIELEKELRQCCQRFNDWIGSQKSYVEFLNGWLLQCLQYEAEQTGDGPLPYSPGQLGAPPIFIICNDWHQAMEAISERTVANTMNAFATSLHQLWEKQDEEERQRIKAEYLSNDYDKLLRSHHMQRGKIERDDDDDDDDDDDAIFSDRTRLSADDSDTRELPLDDVNLNLQFLRQRLVEERMKHKDAMKVVHRAASSSLKGGLVPILKALENLASEALQAHKHVRLPHPHESA